MRIHALTTGTVRVKRAFLYASGGWRRRLDLFLPGPWSSPLPIHCWAVEHAGGLLLVDTGETADAHDIPFARFDVASGQQLPGALARAGLTLADVDTVVLTHLHADHMDGAVHVRGPVLVHDRELAYSRTLAARLAQRVVRQPVPANGYADFGRAIRQKFVLEVSEIGSRVRRAFAANRSSFFTP